MWPAPNGAGLNLRTGGWSLSTLLCALCLASPSHGVADSVLAARPIASPLQQSRSCAFTAPHSPLALGSKLSGDLGRSLSRSSQPLGFLSTKATFGRHSISQRQALPCRSIGVAPVLLQQNSFSRDTACMPISKPQTQLRVLADICDEERDYREADITGTRLFVTGLPASVDDVRLYLAFEEYGRVLEAQVAKPGLGFVVFEDTDTADEALAGMEGEEISGKEIRVKRARSFYIRKEEEARLRLAQAQRERETRTAALAEEHSRRVRAMEEAAYARAQGLSSHTKSFDMRGQRRLVLEEMRREGLLDLSNPLPYRPSPQVLDAKPVRPAAQEASSRQSPSPPRRQLPRYIDEQGMNGGELREDMGQQAAKGEGEGARSPSVPWTQSEEERIKKQAMIEIMKEGDKLSKSGLKGIEVHVNIAQLIRERVEQIKRYEMLRDNRELLSNITFTSFPTQNVRTTGVHGYSYGAEDEEGDVTPEEAALVQLIDADRAGGAGGKLKASAEGKPAAAAPTVKRKRGRPRKSAAKKAKAYVPTGRPRGRPRKQPQPE